MKTKLNKTVLSVIAMIALTTGFASAEKGKVTVNKYLKTNYAIVSAVAGESSNARIMLKDQDGNYFYTSGTVSGSEGLQHLIDLNTLPDGKYTVILSGKSVKEVSTFTVENHKIVVIDNNSVTSSNGIVSGKELTGFINSDGLNRTINIKNVDGSTIYTRSVNKSNYEFALGI